MKKRKLIRAKESRETFEPRLRAYSTLSTAALATAGAAALAGTATVVSAQTVTGDFLLSDVTGGTGTAHVITMPSVAGTGHASVKLSGLGFGTSNKLEVLAVRSVGSFRLSVIGKPVMDSSKLFTGNQKISTAGNFGNYQSAVVFNKSTSSTGGLLKPAANGSASGYLGVRLNKGAGATYYGWVRVKVAADGSGNPYTIQFMDKNGDGIIGAYGPKGGGILAGETSAIPEPASSAAGLALLALGAVGVEELRRRRKQAAA